MTEDAESRRRAFASEAPARRAALVAELSECLARAETLTAAEAAVLRHVFAYAGFTEAGDLRIPALASLWGEGASYVPAVRREASEVRAAVRLLVRRGAFLVVGDEVALDPDAVRRFVAPASAPLAPKRAVRRRAMRAKKR
jgi:hypothetical protein